jgi:hypothetical protein
MTSFKNVLIGLGILSIAAIMLSFKTEQTNSSIYEYRTMTTIESLIEGGAGRSRLMTNIDKYEDKKLKNIYSLVGINFTNVATNNFEITSELTKLSANGWELVSVTAGVHSQSQNGTYEEVTNSGIFLTRYLLRRKL